MLGVGAVLLGTGVTAFGIAPLAPDAADLPVRQVIEALDTAPLGAPLLTDVTLPAASLTLFRSDQVRRDDTAQSLLQRLGVADSAALAFLRNDATARQLFSGRAGKLVTVETNDRHELQRLSARWLPDDERQFQRLVITSGPQGYNVQL
ncbi:MAG TPA: M23 family peptidase, partial [Aquabacterium sp.]|nr:M23 family peptidase [Aquabacterium sp.]